MSKVTAEAKATILTAYCACGKNAAKVAKDFGYSPTAVRGWWASLSTKEKDYYESLSQDVLDEPTIINHTASYIESLYALRTKTLNTMSKMLDNPSTYDVSLGEVSRALKEINESLKAETTSTTLTTSFFDNIPDKITHNS